MVPLGHRDAHVREQGVPGCESRCVVARDREAHPIERQVAGQQRVQAAQGCVVRGRKLDLDEDTPRPGGEFGSRLIARDRNDGRRCRTARGCEHEAVRRLDPGVADQDDGRRRDRRLAGDDTQHFLHGRHDWTGSANALAESPGWIEQ